MKKREFLKAAGLVGATLTVSEGAGYLVRREQTKAARENKKVVALNGSPHENGNTAYALSVIGDVFRRESVDFEVIHIGKSDVKGCIACHSCRRENKDKGCLYTTADEKAWIAAMKASRAILLAAPACFGGIPGTMKSFLDRAFFSGSEHFRHTLGAAVVTTGRSGASMTFESLNQYFTIAEMPIVSSTYWNNIRGLTVENLKQDREGIRTLQHLAENLIQLLIQE
jgi:multimeric flavodoxin WrbA